MPSADPEKSPSPPPQPPTQQTPGPRAAAFIQLYNNALDSTLNAVSYESFAACFPQIAERAEVPLRAMHGGMVGRLEGFAKVRFWISSFCLFGSFPGFFFWVWKG